MEKILLRKKLSIRSWRRGIKELDLILGGFSDKYLSTFELEDLCLFEEFISNEDHLIYNWIFKKVKSPANFDKLVADIQANMEF
ncbi:succinate dehydrogenase assembly factor 2 [Paracoccaceae bacterium]|nr:succinate dehydrogenase assembly factor 2 [Paracoccaceae bacterium]